MKPTSKERWVGRVLRDKWRIDARIARGGVGTVYEATHRNNGSRVAIKVLHPEFSRDDDTRSRFLQEGYAANKVGHPGVVRILDDDVSEEGLAFLVMELLEGEILEQRRIRKGGRLDLAEVHEIADQLLDVIAAAHEKGIVHRDIKPENLFVTKEGRLKVLDFGFAQMISGFRKEQTQTGFLLGTPGFMSPEQAVGNRSQIDAQTDIWAIGATLFTLLSGEPVHLVESAAEALVAAANRPPRSLVEPMGSSLPPRIIEIVDKALAFQKKDRWPTARAMQSALRSVPSRESPRTRPRLPSQIEVSNDRTFVEEEMELTELPRAGLESDRTIQVPPSAMDATVKSGLAADMAGGRPPVPLAQIMGPPRSGRDARAPQTPPMAPRPPISVPPPSSAPGAEGTLIMKPAAAAPMVAAAEIPRPPQTQPFGVSDPRPRARAPSFVDEGEMQVVRTGATRAVEPQSQSRVLPFIAVVLVSMLIVVVTGLLVLGAAE